MKNPFFRILEIGFLLLITFTVCSCGSDDNSTTASDGDRDIIVADGDRDTGTVDGDDDTTEDAEFADADTAEDEEDSEGGCIVDGDDDADNDCTCDGGPCCSDGCHEDSSETVCNPDGLPEYSCQGGTGCGSNVYVRYAVRYCSGFSDSCDGALGEPGEWEIYQDCADSQQCSIATLACVENRAQCDPTYCIEGACCNTDTNTLLPEETICGVPDGVSEEYRCKGTGCGDNLEVRNYSITCSGSSPECDGQTVAGEWELQADCDTLSICDMATKSCIAEPLCEDFSCDDGGPCCNMETHTRRGSDYVCQPLVEERSGCSNSECGGDVIHETASRLCSGLSTSCDGALDWGVPDVLEDCTEMELCNADTLSCETNQPACDDLYCESGTCCDLGTHKLEPLGTMCNLMIPDNPDYRCTETGCGGDLEAQQQYRECTGESPICFGDWIAGNWVVVDSCSGNESCNAEAGECQDAPTCLLGPCPEEMVAIGDFCMDRFEASRSDATVDSAGSDNSIATTRQGVLPWMVNPVSQNDVNTFAAACTAAGKRLCSADEFYSVCTGPDNSTYFFGNQFDPEICNCVDTWCDDYCEELSISTADCNLSTNCGYACGEVGGPTTTCFHVAQTGSFPDCTNTYGAYDINGNIWEIVNSETDYRGFEIRGGAFNCGNPSIRLQCGFNADWLSLYAGFRCCLDREPLR